LTGDRGALGLGVSGHPSGGDGVNVAALFFLRAGHRGPRFGVVAPYFGVRRLRPGGLPPLAPADTVAYQLPFSGGEAHVAAGIASMLIAVVPAFSGPLGRARAFPAGRAHAR
jgi:hypothetical protein